MKDIVPFVLLAACQLCFAGGDTNIVAMSEWSKPVPLRNEQLHDIAIRGRLLIVQGMEPANAAPTINGAMTFIELQNVTGGCCDSIDVYFAITNLHCELSDARGKAIPKPTGEAWGGRGPFLPCWVSLPYNSTLRLFVNGGRMDPLTLYPSGEPWCYWSIPISDTSVYYLSGTLSLSTHTNSSEPPEHWNKMFFDEYRATLVFPKTRITTSRISSRQQDK